MATRLRRGRATGTPTRSQYLRASKAVRADYRQLRKAAAVSAGRMSGS